MYKKVNHEINGWGVTDASPPRPSSNPLSIIDNVSLFKLVIHLTHPPSSLNYS